MVFYDENIIFSWISYNTPLTVNFLHNNPYALLSLLNHPSQNYAAIQKMARFIVWPNTNTFYQDSTNILLSEQKTLNDVLENNFVKSLTPLTHRGVIIGTYPAMLALFGVVKESNQQCCDGIINWTGSMYQIQGMMGIDQKNKNSTNFGRNQALVVSQAKYFYILLDFQDALTRKHSCDAEMRNALFLLSETCLDSQTHLDHWANILHLFPPFWRPPLFLGKTFDDTYLTENAAELLRQGGYLVRRISDRIFAIEKARGGTFCPGAEDVFCDSEIQQLMAEQI